MPVKLKSSNQEERHVLNDFCPYSADDCLDEASLGGRIDASIRKIAINFCPVGWEMFCAERGLNRQAQACVAIWTSGYKIGILGHCCRGALRVSLVGNLYMHVKFNKTGPETSLASTGRI